MVQETIWSLTEPWKALRLFGLRGWIATGLGFVAALIVIGIPAAIIDNPFFIRMTPVRSQDYVYWIIASGLSGLIAGTFAFPGSSVCQGRAVSGGALSYLAVACPICNKLVVLLLGVSGALTFFEPAQFFLGPASILLLGWALLLRLRANLGDQGHSFETRAAHV